MHSVGKLPRYEKDGHVSFGDISHGVGSARSSAASVRATRFCLRERGAMDHKSGKVPPQQQCLPTQCTVNTVKSQASALLAGVAYQNEGAKRNASRTTAELVQAICGPDIAKQLLCLSCDVAEQTAFLESAPSGVPLTDSDVSILQEDQSGVIRRRGLEEFAIQTTKDQNHALHSLADYSAEEGITEFPEEMFFVHDSNLDRTTGGGPVDTSTIDRNVEVGTVGAHTRGLGQSHVGTATKGVQSDSGRSFNDEKTADDWVTAISKSNNITSGAQTATTSFPFTSKVRLKLAEPASRFSDPQSKYRYLDSSARETSSKPNSFEQKHSHSVFQLQRQDSLRTSSASSASSRSSAASMR